MGGVTAGPEGDEHGGFLAVGKDEGADGREGSAEGGLERYRGIPVVFFAEERAAGEKLEEGVIEGGGDPEAAEGVAGDADEVGARAGAGDDEASDEGVAAGADVAARREIGDTARGIAGGVGVIDLDEDGAGGVARAGARRALERPPSQVAMGMAVDRQPAPEPSPHGLPPTAQRH